MSPTPSPSPSTATATSSLSPPPAPPAATKAISIRTYKPNDLPTVIELFSAGMMYYANKPEHASVYKIWADYVAESITDDLAKIDEVYFQSGGHFWVATAQDENDKEVIVGCVALEGKPEKAGELRRMSVSADYRRYGVGRLLVSNLENWAKNNGFDKVWLSTGGPMVQAQKFYLSINYTQTKVEVYSEEPHFEVVYFEKVLREADETCNVTARA